MNHFSRHLSAASWFLAAGVILGAFGAHGLKDVLDAYGKEVYEKAVFYHLTHALGMLITGVAGATALLHERQAHRAVWMFGAGIVLFSGSLYLLAVTGHRWLGMITPLGGTLFIAAWCTLAVGFSRSSSR